MDIDHELFESKKDMLSQLVLNGFWAADYAHKTLFKSVFAEEQSITQEKLTCSLAYLTEAHSTFLAIKIFVFENENLFGDRYEFQELLHQFTTFNNEVLTNVRTNHSHQWSDIEFRTFVEKFKDVAGLLEIENYQDLVDRALKED